MKSVDRHQDDIDGADEQHDLVAGLLLVMLSGHYIEARQLKQLNWTTTLIRAAVDVTSKMAASIIVVIPASRCCRSSSGICSTL